MSLAKVATLTLTLAVVYLWTCSVLLVVPSKRSTKSQFRDDSNKKATNFSSSKPRNILFVESSGKVCLTRRQLCSIESAALHNPDMNVLVFVSTFPVFEESKDDVPPPRDEFRDCDSTLRLSQFPNIRFILDKMNNLLRGTDLYDWVKSGIFYESEYSMFHAGDVLRAALLKRYGGIFLDLDCIVLRPIGHLKNAVGKHEFNWLEAGVVSFEYGHPFSDDLIQSVMDTFEPNTHVSVGPTAVTEAVRRLCNLTEFNVGLYMCRDEWPLTIRPAEEFYAITGPQRLWFYNDVYPPHLWDLLANSSISHVFDNEDGVHKTTNKSIYHLLAKTHCPWSFQRSISALGYF